MCMPGKTIRCGKGSERALESIPLLEVGFTWRTFTATASIAAVILARVCTSDHSRLVCTTMNISCPFIQMSLYPLLPLYFFGRAHSHARSLVTAHQCIQCIGSPADRDIRLSQTLGEQCAMLELSCMDRISTCIRNFISFRLFLFIILFFYFRV